MSGYSRTRKGTMVNAIGLYIAGAINLYVAVTRPDWKLLVVTAFCAVMGTHWLILGRRYYR